MCLNNEKDLYYDDRGLSSDDEEVENNDDDVQWPFAETNETARIVACRTCFYPITFVANIGEVIRDDTTNEILAFVVPVQRLFKKTIVRNDNFIDQWRTQVICAKCGFFLSFANNPQKNEINTFRCIEDDQAVILALKLIQCGSADDIYKLFMDN